MVFLSLQPAQFTWGKVGTTHVVRYSDSLTEGETPNAASFPVTVGPSFSPLRQHCGLFPERAPPERGVTQAISLQDARSPRGPAGDTCPPRPGGGPARHTGVSSRERGAGRPPGLRASCGLAASPVTAQDWKLTGPQVCVQAAGCTMEVVLLSSVRQLLLNPGEREALFTRTFETSAAHLSYSRARSLTLPWIRQPVMGRDSLGLHPGCLWSPCPAHRPPSFLAGIPAVLSSESPVLVSAPPRHLHCGLLTSGVHDLSARGSHSSP